MGTLLEPHLEFVCELSVRLAPGQLVGETAHGTRSIHYVVEGIAEGPHLRGRVLPGGGDWFLRRPDGVGELDIRGTIETHDGALLYASYRGYRYEVRPGMLGPLESIESTEADPRGKHYFVTAPFFETASPQYAWLTRVVCVGIGMSTEEGVRYRVFAIR